MADQSLSMVMRRLRSALGGPGGADVNDRQLLQRIAERRDTEAFEALIRRHGPLVLGVCRRVLCHEHDAEDAFQATFLVLAARAGSVGWRESIGGWLYQAAYQVATRARRAAARRHHHEQRAMTMSPTDATTPATTADWDEVQPILDEELHRLPEKYRMPLLLCHLQGKSRDEAATLLGWSATEVKGRLQRGRELLRNRLVRRGITATAASLPLLLGQGAIAAAPASLISATVQSADAADASASVAALTQGALKAMFLAKLKKSGLIAVLGVALLGSGLGVSMLGTRGTSTAHAIPIPADRPAPRDSEPVEKDGLSVTVTPAKTKFTSKDPLAFTVTLKNVSREPFMLFESTDFWAWKIKAGDWQAQNLRNDIKGPYPPSVVLEPGKSIEIMVKLDDPFRFEYRWTGENKQVVEPKKSLPPGKYPLVVVLSFKEDVRPEQRANYKHRHWTGEIASRPIEIVYE